MNAAEKVAAIKHILEGGVILEGGALKRRACAYNTKTKRCGATKKHDKRQELCKRNTTTNRCVKKKWKEYMNDQLEERGSAWVEAGKDGGTIAQLKQILKENYERR